MNNSVCGHGVGIHRSGIEGRNKLRSSWLLLALVSVCLTATIIAQDDKNRELPKDAEPPPIKVITKEEREKLDARGQSVKNRIKLSLEMMEERLLMAEEHSSKSEFREMFKDLGRFHALVDNALAYLNRFDTGRSGFLKNFKRYEIGLRQFLPRLQMLRRDLPPKFEYYVRNLIFAVRDARRKAVDPFFDDTVIPNNDATGSS